MNSLNFLYRIRISLLCCSSIGISIFFLRFFFFFLKVTIITLTFLSAIESTSEFEKLYLKMDEHTVGETTSNSQRTLVTPPIWEADFSRERRAGNQGETVQYRGQRLAWADQVVQNYSLDSRLPASNNLQSELDRASRMNLSADGFQLPSRVYPTATSQETPGSTWLRAPPNIS